LSIPQKLRDPSSYNCPTLFGYNEKDQDGQLERIYFAHLGPHDQAFEMEKRKQVDVHKDIQVHPENEEFLVSEVQKLLAS